MLATREKECLLEYSTLNIVRFIRRVSTTAILLVLALLSETTASDFGPLQIPQSPDVFDPLTTYNIGDYVGQTVATDKWQCSGNQGMPIVADETYSPTGAMTNGGFGKCWRKEAFSINQWAAFQAVTPFSYPSTGICTRVNSDGSGYCLVNVFYGGETCPSSTYNFQYTTIGNTGLQTYHFYSTPQSAITGEILEGELYLYRFNSDGSSDLIGYWYNCTSNPVWLDVNYDKTFFMLETIGTNPVQIRVSVMYLDGINDNRIQQLPSNTVGILAIGTINDSSVKRITMGNPGVIGGSGGTAGAFMGFNAGSIVSLPMNTVYTVTPLSGAGGSISPPAAQTVISGSAMSYTVSPDAGYHITSISGCSGTDPGTQPYNTLYSYATGRITTDCTVKASFDLNQHNLRVNSAGTGRGTVGGSGSYEYGTSQNVTAKADVGSTFAGWTGDCSSAVSSYIVKMLDRDMTCTAIFILNQHYLEVNTAGNGSGAVGGGGLFDYGTIHAVIAAAITGSSFTGWSGDCSGITSPYSVTILDRDMTCTATFAKNSYTVVAIVAGGNGSISCTPTSVSYEGSFQCSISPSSGYYLQNLIDNTISVIGSVSNDVYSVTNVTVDHHIVATFQQMLPPVLTISTLSDGSWTNNGTLNISGTATDDMGIPTLTINGTPVTVMPDRTFSYAFSLMAGSNTITTMASVLGLQTTDTRTINYEPSATNIALSMPADNSVTNQSPIAVTGTVDQTSSVTIRVNDDSPLQAQMSENNFTLKVPLTYGINTVEVTAKDLATNESTLKRTITYDDLGPNLALTQPSQDITTNQSILLIQGKVIDLTQATVSITVDGAIYTLPVVNGAFEQLITFTTEKTYHIYAIATDQAGNATTVQRNVIYDKTPPSVTLDPVPTLTNKNSQAVTGTMEANAMVTVICPTASVGQVTYPSQTTWTATLEDMAEANNLITVSVTDNAGNVSSQITATIIVDTLPPNTIITSTPANPTTSTSEVFNFVSSETNSTFQCQLDGGEYQSCASPKSYSNLPIGDHTFTVKATDRIGNVDPTPASYAWTITQAQLSDLSGSWNSLPAKAKGKQVTLTGTLQVTNSGNKATGSFVVTYYLSNDGLALSSVLDSNTVKSLNAGKSTSLSFSYSTSTSLTNKYIIAVIDSGNAVAELNENNNRAVVKIP